MLGHGPLPSPRIAELSPRPPTVLSIDEQLLASMPIDPFDVARTRKRKTMADEVARVVLSADTTLEVDALELQDVCDSDAAMVAVAPILTPVPFASPAAYQYVQDVRATGSARTGSRFLRFGTFAIAAVFAVLGGSALAIAATPAQKTPSERRHVDGLVRTKLPPSRHVAK
jgi:hypothetical protein